MLVLTIRLVACLPQARLRANRHELEALQAAVGMQAAAAGAPTARRGENRRAFKAPAMPIMPPGYDPADTVLFQQQLQRRALSGAAAAAAAAPIPPPPQQQQQHGQMRSYDFGQMMAQMLLSMPMGRAGRTTGGQAASSAARRGLPPSLVHMREAVIGMQRAGLPPHMLFSDRDFTAGTVVETAVVPCSPSSMWYAPRTCVLGFQAVTAGVCVMPLFVVQLPGGQGPCCRSLHVLLETIAVR